MNDADRESYERAVTYSAFQVNDPSSSDHGRRIHHCFLGGIGADWDEDAVLELLNKDSADACYESSFLWGEGLAVYLDGKRFFFDTVREPRAD